MQSLFAVRNIHIPITCVLADDVGQLLTVLVQFNKDQLAKQLQCTFAALLEMVKNRIPSIWASVDAQNTVRPS